MGKDASKMKDRKEKLAREYEALGDSPVMLSAERRLTGKQVAEEIREDSDLGKKMGKIARDCYIT